jgi:hypothetical protein
VPGFVIAGMNNSVLEDAVIQALAQYEEKQVTQ